MSSLPPPFLLLSWDHLSNKLPAPKPSSLTLLPGTSYLRQVHSVKGCPYSNGPMGHIAPKRRNKPRYGTNNLGIRRTSNIVVRFRKGRKEGDTIFVLGSQAIHGGIPADNWQSKSLCKNKVWCSQTGQCQHRAPGPPIRGLNLLDRGPESETHIWHWFNMSRSSEEC